ncbi:sulfatase-like hydrolase/transferase [Tautonia rosea]|uniref:sulfatase-like hydrolase/transferase n=1 Tax=Tautonia rosea TaxID=2728037 RepID=UPI001473AB44|nr:sulfatase-like hydrolase/transferase [Tautonia rosea]
MRIVLGILTTLVIGLGTTASRAEDEVRPNILLILVDDLGKEWIGCYGAEGIETPHIDALAAGGMRFELAYAMPQCTPTRLTLLTGQYPFRHGWVNHWDVPRFGGGAHFDPEQNASIPLLLRDAGYATAAAGKWQIDDFRVEPMAMFEAGFDSWCMWTGGEGGNPPSDERYWNPYIASGDASGASPSATYRGAFGPEVFATSLIDFMRSHRDRPMFLYFPMVLVHSPQVPTPSEPGAESAQERHAAMVRATDATIGRLVQAVDDLGLRERTIIIVTTDNGTGGNITGRRLGREIRGAKAQLSEAGTAMPFIVNGPGLVPQGVVTEALTDFTDLFPTLAELAGAKVPDNRVVDGRSIAPLIRGEVDDSPRDWILSLGRGPAVFRDGRVVPAQRYIDRVIRDRRFKLWIGLDRAPTALYDLQADPWEEHNLLDSTDPEILTARDRLLAVAATFPEHDATPRYRPNPPQPWDRPPSARRPIARD